MKDNKKDQGKEEVSKYFANKDDKECAAILMEKSDGWYNKLEALGYIEKLRNMYAAYHGAYTASVGEAHQITFTGDQGELVEVAVNNFRNLAEHMLTMTTTTRPTMEARATNTDSKSIVQTQLANGLLDYYMRDRRYRLEDKLKLACEYAIVLGTGYLKLSWNGTSGNVVNKQEIQDADPKNPVEPEYEGDIEFTNLSALDVVMDLSKEGYDHNWVMCRSYLNRYDLIAKYPESAEEIKNIPCKESRYDIKMGVSAGQEETDDIPVFEFYHKKTDAVPEGKYMFFASEKAVFYEGPLPYRRIPVYRISPSQIMGTPLGYSNMFDVLPLQDATNVLLSAAFTNQSAFAVQNILNPQGNNIDVNQLSSGLNIIDYNPQAGEPKPLQLTKTPPEVFNMIDMLNGYQETISGINSVVRGNPEANLRSGSAIAMIQSNAIQFMSGLQSSYIHLIEDVGLGLIEMLVDFAQYPRIANIAGESKRSYVKEFIGDDISDISRVIVDVANPLTKTIAGRVQMADNLLQYQQITPDQYFAIINSGKLEAGIEEKESQLVLVKSENEGFLRGEPAAATVLDKHRQHIIGHRMVVDDPELRKNPQQLEVVLAHIMEHIDMLKTTDPMVLSLTGEEPIQMPQEPMQQQAPPTPEGNAEMMQAPQVMDPVESQMLAVPGVEQDIRLPNGVNPEDVPLTPEDNLMRTQGIPVIPEGEL